MELVKPNHPALWTVAQAVHNMEGQVLPYLKEMRILMEANKGVGLAAPQVGISARFFITQLAEAHTVINPHISYMGGRVSATEGCLSKPGYRTFVLRHSEVLLHWVTPRWEARERLFSGYAARVIQHEFDHLNGICVFENPCPDPVLAQKTP